MKKLLCLLAVAALFSISASAQYVTKSLDSDLHPTFDISKYTNYVPIWVGEKEYDAMAEAGIRLDLTLDGNERNMWVWNGYQQIEAEGPNSFNEDESHFCLYVTGVNGWSGQGFAASAAYPVDLSFIDDTYKVHFAIKGDHSFPHSIWFGSAKMSVGDTEFVDGNNIYTSVGTWEGQDEWYNFDIPFSKLTEIATSFPVQADGVWSEANGGASSYMENYFASLSGGTEGVELHLDNMFFYQDTTNDIATPNVNDGIKTIYDLQGRVVENPKLPGIYILIDGQGSRKVVLK